jgi:hypothetical protein
VIYLVAHRYQPRSRIREATGSRKPVSIYADVLEKLAGSTDLMQIKDENEFAVFTGDKRDRSC